MKIKTIDVNAKEWFDKVNGNSYFAGTVTVNFGMPDEQKYIMPFQYGYGDYYEQAAGETLDDAGLIPDVRRWSSGGIEPLWQYCRDRGVIYRRNIVRNCKKSELKNI